MSIKGGAVRKRKVYGQKIEQKRNQTTCGSREKSNSYNEYRVKQ